MSVPFFDLTRQYSEIHNDIARAMKPVLDSQGFIMGREVDAFEREIAERVGAKHAIAVASGTDALLLALKALDAAPGSDVVIPAFTFFATAGAVWNAGLRPVFCDVDPETMNVTRDSLEAAWTERTVAVIPVHLFGQMAAMTDVTEVAEARGAIVIEDVAQAIGATQECRGRTRAAGSIGSLGAFSFFPTKNLGAYGDAGMVTSQDDALAERVAKLRVHGGRRMYHHEFVGTNSRLDALQAAVLRAKLPHLDGWLDARRRNAERYVERLGDVSGIRVPVTREGNLHTYNQFTVRAERRDELRAWLGDRGIGCNLYYPIPLHLQPCFSELGYTEGRLPESEALTREVLSLPIFPELRADELDAAADAVRAFYA
jgi:dTDP-4-amino-4,6-dideoxygalactose transaminase